MKKLISVLFLAGIVSLFVAVPSSAAWTANSWQPITRKIDYIRLNGDLYISCGNEPVLLQIQATNPNFKTLLSMALSAKASGNGINVYIGSVPSSGSIIITTFEVN